VAAQSKSSTKGPAEETIERIRALNEQILEKSSEYGAGFLDAYEQSMETFAEYQSRAAEGTDVEWVSQIAKAQADFTREVAKLTTTAARQFLK
jgi:hypothetical protein